jgi:hypothetical protein
MQGNITIGELPIKDYKYRWTPSAFLNSDSKTQTVFNYDWQAYPYYRDTTLIYLLDIIRPQGCLSTDTILVPVKGLPFLAQPRDTVLCDGEPFSVLFSDPHNPATTFSWSCEGGLPAGFPLSGNSSTINISAVHNMASQPLVVTLRVTPRRNGCEGETKYFFVTINPKPRTYLIADQFNCAGTTVPALSIAGNLPEASYQWGLVSGTSVTGSNSGTGVIPSYIAQNTTTGTLTGYYQAWAVYTYGGKSCSSDRVNFTVSVEPMPTVTTAGSTELCSGDNLSLTFSGTPAGNTNHYQKMSGGNIPGLPSMGTGNISLTGVVNSGTSPISSVYRITPVSASGRCTGAQENITINLYPIPAISGLRSFTQCSGEVFGYTLSSTVAGVGFTWEQTPAFSLRRDTQLSLSESAEISEFNTPLPDLGYAKW